MRKSPASIATLRSRLRATHEILEELVIVKVAANGIRTHEAMKAIEELEKNASLGFDNITVCPGLVRLRATEQVEKRIKGRLAPIEIEKSASVDGFQPIHYTNQLGKAA